MLALSTSRTTCKVIVGNSKRLYSSRPPALILRSGFTLSYHPSLQYSRSLSTSTSLKSSDALSKTIETQETVTASGDSTYEGPLAQTFRRLKLFSLASFGLSSALAPFMFIVESGLPPSARFALAGIALGTSGLSTGLVAWCAKPYVNKMYTHRPDAPGAAEELELITSDLFLRPITTKVYDPSFLIETRRPLARWELAPQIVLTASRAQEAGINVHPTPGSEETVAETRNQAGDVLGRWIVKWGENGHGVCHEAGRVNRYFNVHEELLQ
ncbi:hypothetical protein CVT24_005987 [Panaeolus cyanescens]|uniref:Uncharacterized protein n=1 Tax=Panaeolus cyanescens TaxID=181874 RepID=A0A409V8V3_9AGAR|nr:hypothetical protein CVT24_005987 [Panaeolus cyanescens]